MRCCFTPGRRSESHLLVFLYEKGEQPGFAEKLADCFEKGADTDALIDEIRKAFGISVSDDDLKALLNAVSAEVINFSGYENPKTKNAHDLALFAKRAKAGGWGYRQKKKEGFLRCPKSPALRFGRKGISASISGMAR